MKCRHFFSFVFVLFLLFFFGSFITISDTFATSVSCSLSSVSSSTLLSDFCDFSSLDSSVDWYYSVSNFSLSSSSRFLYFSIDSSTNGYNIPIKNGFNFSNVFVGSSSSVIVSDFSFSFKDYVSFNSYFSNSPYFHHYIYYLSPSSFNLTVSDIPPISGIIPSGELVITANGTYDVTNYASASVNVPAEVTQGDYHDDLVNINQSIIVCGAILLVLYFFYCIYRLIIKNSVVH